MLGPERLLLLFLEGQAVTKLDCALGLAFAFQRSIILELLLDLPVTFRVPFTMDVSARADALVIVNARPTMVSCR